MQDRRAILEAFRSCRHTPTSRQILDGLDSRKFRVIFRKGMPDPGKANGKSILIDIARQFPDILATPVHEGRHHLDILEDRIPHPDWPRSPAETLRAEARAFRAAYDFVRRNDLHEAEVHALFQHDRRVVLQSIMNSYEKEIIDQEISDDDFLSSLRILSEPLV